MSEGQSQTATPAPRPRAAKAVGWTLVEFLGSQGIGVALILVLTRLIHPREFGVFAAGLLVATILTRVAPLGLDTAIVQRDSLRPSTVPTAFALAGGCAIILTTAVIGLRHQIAKLFETPELAGLLPIFAIALIPATLNTIGTGVLRRQLRMASLAGRTLSANLFSGAIALVVAFAGYGMEALLVQYTVGVALTFLLTIVLVRSSLKLKFSGRDARSLLSFGWAMAGSDLLATYNRESPRLFVGLLLGPQALGIMALATRILNLLSNLLGTTFTKSGVPLIADVNRSGKSVTDAYMRMVRLASTVILPMFVFMLIGSWDITAILFGDTWASTAPVMAVLCASGLLTAMNYLNGATIIALGKVRYRLVMSVARAISGTVLMLVAAPHGLIWAAWAMVLRGLMIEPFQLMHLLRLLTLPATRYLSAIRTGLLVTASTAVAWGGVSIIPTLDQPLLRLILVAIATGLAASWLILRTDSALRQELATAVPARISRLREVK